MNQNGCGGCPRRVSDYGGRPLVIDIDRAAKSNCYYRTALWTGEYLQVTLMSIPAGGDIGAEVHCDGDQALFVVSGCGVAVTGPCCGDMNCRQKVEAGSAVIIPAGTWHNIINTGSAPLKLYSVYAPPEHPFGTVQRTKADAQCGE